MRADLEAEVERCGGMEAFVGLCWWRHHLLDRLTRRMVLKAHGLEAGGWSEAPFPVRVVEARDG